MWNGTQSKTSLKPNAPSSWSGKKTAFLVANAPATSDASVVDWAVNPRTPTLKLTGPLYIIFMHDEVEFSAARVVASVSVRVRVEPESSSLVCDAEIHRPG